MTRYSAPATSRIPAMSSAMQDQSESRSSSRRRRSSSSGEAATPGTGVSGATTAPATRDQRRSTSARTAPATRMSSEGTKYPARLKPRFGGAMRIATPCSRTNASMISGRSEEHTSELQSRLHLVCRLLLEKKKNKTDHQKKQNTQYGNALTT